MVTRYTVDLDDKKHPLLVAEEDIEYGEKNMKDPKAVVDMLNTCFRLNKKAEEHVYMVCFSSSCEVLGVFEISHGTMRESYSGRRETFLRAALCGAAFFIIAHNHPSGDVTPSPTDKKTADAIVEFGKMMDIPILDFIIVGGDDFCSFSRKGLIKVKITN